MPRRSIRRWWPPVLSAKRVSVNAGWPSSGGEGRRVTKPTETPPRSTPGGLWRWRPRMAAAAGICVVALVVLTLAVAGRSPYAWEGDVVDAATRIPDALGYPARGVMELGTLRLALAVALIAGLVLGSWRPVLALAGAVLVAWFVSNELKDLVDRHRPV